MAARHTGINRQAARHDAARQITFHVIQRGRPGIGVVCPHFHGFHGIAEQDNHWRRGIRHNHRIHRNRHFGKRSQRTIACREPQHVDPVHTEARSCIHRIGILKGRRPRSGHPAPGGRHRRWRIRQPVITDRPIERRAAWQGDRLRRARIHTWRIVRRRAPGTVHDGDRGVVRREDRVERAERERRDHRFVGLEDPIG